jgi:hypothetical protein
METRSVTIREVVEAINAAGYPQGFYHAIEWSHPTEEYEGTIVNACAIGQAALNLGVDPEFLEMYLYEVKSRKNSTFSLREFIVELNDEKKFDLPRIAKEVEVKFKAKLNEQFAVAVMDYSSIPNYQGKKL